MEEHHTCRYLRAAMLSTLALLLSATLSGCRAGTRHGDVSVSLDSKLGELTNVACFATPPHGKPGMISTYDRTGGNEDWARLDRPGHDGTITLAELDGPGCVTRIWMTVVPADQWLFYFDGEKIPRLKFSKSDLFGKTPPFLPPISDMVSSGNYCYMPLPFAKSLRIAITVPDWQPHMRPYFQINYETYPKGTGVASFPDQLSNEQLAHIANVRDAWSSTSTIAQQEQHLPSIATNMAIHPGRAFEWLNREQPGTLRFFQIHVELPPDTSALARARMLRLLSLRFWWDGIGTPSVNVPLGDFFCDGLFRRTFDSDPIAVTENSFTCRFPMPFKKSARAEIANESNIPVLADVRYSIDHAAPSAGESYFHALWNSTVSRGIPHRVLTATGQGHFVGCYLVAIGTDGSWNIMEGDDLMRLNGEVFPSIHGTGLEDYFNGAWYYDGLFDLPLHGLVEKAAMRTSQYRFHLPDRIGFDDGLVFDFEFGPGNAARGYISSTAYWYQPDPHAVSALPAQGQRFPPPDPLEPSIAICRLIELERIGAMDQAASVCLEYSEKFAGHPWGLIFQLRATAYLEEIEELASARPSYERIKQQSSDPEVVKQAEHLLWFNTASTNALLGIGGFCRFKAYVDGQSLGGEDNPALLSVYPVALSPGDHEIAIEMTPTRPDAFLMAYLRCHGTNIISDASWAYSRERPANWPRTAGDDVKWEPVFAAAHSLPKMVYWQFVPNAYIKMQSPRSGIRPWENWHADGLTAYLRKRFVIE